MATRKNFFASLGSGAVGAVLGYRIGTGNASQPTVVAQQAGAEYGYNVKAYGAKGDGTTNDAPAIQALIDSLGDASSMRSATLFFPAGEYRIDATIEINLKALYLIGVGAGSSRMLQGSVLKWGGSAGRPMVRFRQCWHAGVERMRFMGNSRALPSAAIDIFTGERDSPRNTQLAFRDIWIGSYSSFDTDNATQFVSGIITSGENAQGDQSLMEHVCIQGVTDYGIRLANSQNVLWRLSNLLINAGLTARGISTAARHTMVQNVFFQTNGVDIEVTNDASIDVYSMGSEISGRLLHAPAGCRASFRGGYWQSSSNTSRDNNVIDVTDATLRFEDFGLTRTGSYRGSGEKCRMRGRYAVFIGSSVGLPVAPPAFLDLATTGSGQRRRIEWGGLASGSFVNEWAHGDAGMPNFRTARVDQRRGDRASALSEQ